MIGTRLAAAFALMLSVIAVALGVAALLATLRDEGPERGRLVQTRLLPSEGEPVLFPLDDFYSSNGADGAFRALYVYPPGFHGHTRGCKVVWIADTAFGSAGAFVDPCGGARFDRDGAWLSGPAERGLDEFKTEPGIEGVIVDTRTLYCGAALGPASAASTPAATPTAASATEPEARDECDRVSPDTD